MTLKPSHEIQWAHNLQEHQNAIQSVIDASHKVEAVVDKMAEALQNGHKILWCGNGGSAADAQHMAAELMVRYLKDRQPLASIALTTDSSILTAHSNDYEFDTVFSRQIQGLARPGDILIALSTSGSSANVVKAVEAAREVGCYSVAMIGGKQGVLLDLADVCFEINSTETARVQEAHSFLSHLLCEGLDGYFD